MAEKNNNVKRIAGLAWLLMAFLVALATVTAQADRQIESEGEQLTGGVNVGAPIGAPMRGS